MTADGGWEKVLQVWWARRTRATGNVALSTLRGRSQGLGVGGRGQYAPRPPQEGSWTLRVASQQWEPRAAERVGGGAQPLSSLRGAKDVGWGRRVRQGR